MAKIFVTGSTSSLGLLASQALTSRGHEVHLHARNSKRASDARSACPGAAGVFTADLTSLAETRSLADQLNKAGPWDAIVHNAGSMTTDKFAINVVAPYVLTCLVDPPPKRHVFLTSGMHLSGSPRTSGPSAQETLERSSYSDTKLHDVMLSMYFSRLFSSSSGESNTKTLVNVMNPGWVPIGMGGKGAPDSIEAAIETYVMLAEDSGSAKGRTGKYWYQSQDKQRYNSKIGDDAAEQERLVACLEKATGVKPPNLTS